MTGLLLAAILAPLAASIASLITGWRRTTATLTALSATTVLACAVAMGFWMGSGAQFGLGGLLRADALTVVMLVVIGIVGTLATAASIGYIDTELAPCGATNPSWFNWPALPVAMADTIVPDFPLANKSFNQSYAGNDL